jgi:hypothetical protein
MMPARSDSETIHFARNEISRLIKNEIDFGFAFLGKYAVSEGEPAAAALANAILAHENASYLIGRLSPDEGDLFRPRLNELAAALRLKEQQEDERWKRHYACDGPTQSGILSPHRRLLEGIPKLDLKPE